MFLYLFYLIFLYLFVVLIGFSLIVFIFIFLWNCAIFALNFINNIFSRFGRFIFAVEVLINLKSLVEVILSLDIINTIFEQVLDEVHHGLVISRYFIIALLVGFGSNILLLLLTAERIINRFRLRNIFLMNILHKLALTFNFFTKKIFTNILSIICG